MSDVFELSLYEHWWLISSFIVNVLFFRTVTGATTKSTTARLKFSSTESEFAYSSAAIMGKYPHVYTDPLLASLKMFASLKNDVPQGSVIGALWFSYDENNKSESCHTLAHIYNMWGISFQNKASTPSCSCFLHWWSVYSLNGSTEISRNMLVYK